MCPGCKGRPVVYANFHDHFRRFLRCENGAITVDWVVLCGAVLILVILAMTPIYQAADIMLMDIAEQLSFSNVTDDFR